MTILSLAILLSVFLRHASGMTDEAKIYDLPLLQLTLDYSAAQAALPKDGLLVDGQEEHGQVDLMVARFCEDPFLWLNELNSTFAQYVNIFIYDKGGESCKYIEPGEYRHLPFKVTIIRMRNVGRDGHSQVVHTIRYYDRLAEYTIMLQAGFHWTLGSLERPGVHLIGWKDQAEAVEDVVPILLSSTPHFLPMIHHHGPGPTLFVPVLWEDAEFDWTAEQMKPRANTLVFGAVELDMNHEGRELYAIMFGKSPCSVKSLRFAAGMQYAVSKTALFFRSIEFWKKLEHMLQTCDRSSWAYERVTTSVFSTLSVADPSTWRNPALCQKETWQAFENSKNWTQRTEFWSKHWGCEVR